MKAIKQYFHVVLFIMLLTFKSNGVTIQMKVIEKNFHVVLFFYAV